MDVHEIDFGLLTNDEVARINMRAEESIVDSDEMQSASLGAAGGAAAGGYAAAQGAMRA